MSNRGIQKGFIVFNIGRCPPCGSRGRREISPLLVRESKRDLEIPIVFPLKIKGESVLLLIILFH
jgi:hypothetical protein